VEIRAQEQIAQFAVMLGVACDSARLAGLPVRVELDDGSIIEGIPSQPTEGRTPSDEFDHSGTRKWLELDRTAILTARVRSFRVARID
jgi:hypothetical protein